MGGGAVPSNARQLKETAGDISDDGMNGSAPAASLTAFPEPLKMDKGKGKLQEAEASDRACLFHFRLFRTQSCSSWLFTVDHLRK